MMDEKVAQEYVEAALVHYAARYNELMNARLGDVGDMKVIEADDLPPIAHHYWVGREHVEEILRLFQRDEIRVMSRADIEEMARQLRELHDAVAEMKKDEGA